MKGSALSVTAFDRVPAYLDRHSVRPAFPDAQAEQVATFARNAPRHEGAA